MTRSWQSLAGSAAMRNQLHRRLGRCVQRTYCSLPQHNSRRRLRHIYAETTRDIGAPTWINGAIERDTSAMRDSKSPHRLCTAQQEPFKKQDCLYQSGLPENRASCVISSKCGARATLTRDLGMVVISSAELHDAPAILALQRLAYQSEA